MVIKFVVFFSHLCYALRKRPKEAYSGILVQTRLWLTMVFPLIVFKLWINLNITTFLTLFCFKIHLLAEPQGKHEITHSSDWCWNQPPVQVFPCQNELYDVFWDPESISEVFLAVNSFLLDIFYCLFKQYVLSPNLGNILGRQGTEALSRLSAFQYSCEVITYSKDKTSLHPSSAFSYFFFSWVFLDTEP